MWRSAVEESPVTSPSCFRIASRMYDVEVLPLVPVTPSSRGGCSLVR